MNEFDVIGHIKSLLPEKPSEVEVPIGDDCAVLHLGDQTWVAAADMLVEGRHFESWSQPEDVGYKAVAVNVSDVAAMGGEPRFILTSGGSPDSETALRLFEGVIEACHEFGVYPIGGDTTSSDSLVVDVSIIGSVTAGEPVLRSGAKVGDVIAVSGELGASAAGLCAFRAGQRMVERYGRLCERHLRPEPRVEAGVAAARFGASAMIDLSDGISSDARHIAGASEVGVELHLDRFPVAEDVLSLAEELGLEPLALAATGGEDYELMIVASPEVMERISGEAGVPVTVVGEVVEGGEVRMLRGGQEVEGLSGWDHFSS